MLDKVLFVAGGQGAGKIADCVKDVGIQVVRFNYSPNDLRASENAEESELLLLKGSNGVGKDRNLAKKLLDVGNVISFFNDTLRNTEIKIVIFSFACGGGSGSGVSSIIIEALRYEYPDLVFVAMPILPDLDESYVAQMNTINALQELSELDILCLPIDNQEPKRMNPSLSRHKIYEIINSKVADLLFKVFSYPQLDSKNQFDETDLLRLLSSSGNGIIAEVDILSAKNSNIAKEGIIKSVHESWEQSIFSPIEFDYVTKAAIISDCQEELMDFVHTDDIFNKFKVKPMYVYNGSYHEHKGKIITILSGLPWCNSRLRLIEEIVESNKTKYETVMSGSKYKYEMSDSAKEVVNMMQTPTKQVKEKPDWRSLLNKYSKK